MLHAGEKNEKKTAGHERSWSEYGFLRRWWRDERQLFLTLVAVVNIHAHERATTDSRDGAKRNRGGS